MRAGKPHRVLPGFPLALGYTLVYLALIVLIPLSAVFLKSASLNWEQFWAVISAPRVLASYRVSFGLSLLAAAINAVFGLIFAWVLVRYHFPGKRLVDALVDLPFALPTAVAGIALTAIYAGNGWLGQWLEPLGLKVAFTPLGILVALIFIGLPFVVRTVQPVLEDLDTELEEAAASLGADRWQTFRHVLLPVLLPALLTGFALAFARAVGEYGSVIFIAGNVPMVSVGTVVRNAFTRSDAIIKTPSNDPLTATAIARTMVEMDREHPLTKHLSVVYWKGGDENVEKEIYDPRGVEKIVAWGGFAGIKHVTRYLQPGLDLITLDPKHSSTIIGREAFDDEATLASVARRLALDVGAMNQEGCVNARVVYVQSGTDAMGLARANRLGELTFAALQQLPEFLSTPHKAFDPTLKDEIDGLRYAGEEYVVYGGRSNEGAIIVSQNDAPVDFARQLACRVGNIVPIDDIDTAVRSVNAYTQTIGIYPEQLKTALRDRLSYQGAQRLVSLGAAALFEDAATPQDGIEPVRRMCKWIVEQTSDPVMLDQLARGM